jgi:hypothetical protein
VAWGLAAVLVADAKAVAHLRRLTPACAGGTLPPISRLQVAARLSGTALRPGQTVRGVATLTNRGTVPVVVGGVRALLREPAADHPATWSEVSASVVTVLGPGEYTTVAFTVHVARCPGGHDLTPGFYELVLVLGPGGGQRRSGPTAVVVSP